MADHLRRFMPTARTVHLFPERAVFTRFIPPLRADGMLAAWRHYWRHYSLLAALLERCETTRERIDPAHLRQRGMDGLIVTGSETDVCVLATVLGAVDAGYLLILVCDPVRSSSDEAMRR